MNILRALLVAVALLSPTVAFAVEPDEMLADPALEARARVLSKELRCMVCQNQSIDDSNAPLAHDLRVIVRERLTAGDSNAQVLDFLVARYGEFVLLKPPLSWHTVVLWLGPPGLLFGGAFGLLLLAWRRSRRGLADASRPVGGELTAAEQARLARLTNAREG